MFFFSGLLAPLLVAIVLAYLLEWPTVRLERIGLSRTWATSLVLILFVGILLLLAFVPRNRGLAGQVWKEMNQQITNYIRGKVLEMIVVSVATWIGFILFGLNYSLLLAVLVGFSVLIPYIGAFVVTIPVVGVALFQFGAGTEFWSLFAVYLIIQGLDGNLLVPVLFSEAVNLHPLVIILSVVIFGGLWGFWGVFFAIPLATLIKAVVHAWPDGLVVDDD